MRKESPQQKDHRSQLTNRFLQEGEQSFSNRELLELLLYYCAPKEKSQELTDRLFLLSDNLSGLLELSTNSLEDCGCNLSIITLFRLIPALCAKKAIDDNQIKYKDKPLADQESISQFLFPYFIGQKQERLLMLLLNDKHQYLYCDYISKGTSMSASINFNTILQMASFYQASYLILAHNHPSGVALPSQNDINTTVRLNNILGTIGVKLMDHYIFGENNFCAMSSMETLKDIFHDTSS